MTLRITLDRKSLKAALAHAARVTERRNTIPILSHVRLIISADVVRLVATDLDLELAQELPAATEGAGNLVMPLDVLKNAVGKFAGEMIQLEDMGGKASIQCLTSKARAILPTLPADDWPSIKRGDVLSGFTMPVEPFAAAFATVLPFASTEETRYYLQGIFMHAVNERPGARTEEHEALTTALAELRKADQVGADAAAEAVAEGSQAALAVAAFARGLERKAIQDRIDVLEAERTKPDVLRFATTDGHRLGRVTLPLPEGAAELPDMIVPRKACKVLGQLIGKKPDYADVHVAANRTKVEFRYGRFTLLTKLIDGTFPDYSRVIPTANDTHVTVPASEFAVAVDSVTAIANEKTKAVAMTVSESEGVILTCSSPEKGRAAAIFEGGTVAAAEPRSIGFNAGYLGQILSAFTGDVTIQISDAAAPVRIESPDRPELLIVLMPMRVDAAIETRAQVEAMHLNPFAKLQRQLADIAKAIADADAAGKARGYVLKGVADTFIKPAIAFLVAQGEARGIARLKVKAELAYAAGDAAAGDRAARILEAYEAPPLGDGFDGLRIWGAGGVFDSLDKLAQPEPVAEAEPVQPAAAERDLAPPQDLSPEPVAEPEPVVAEPEPAPAAPEAAEIWIEPVAVVKVLSLTDQALFVAEADYADASLSVLPRYHRDGHRFYGRGGAGTVLRSNIARVVLPRNRGDKPLPVAKPVAAPAVAVAPAAPDTGVAARLAALERIVAGLAAPEPVAAPKRSEARMRGIRAYLALRAKRRELERTRASLMETSVRWRDALEAVSAAERKAAKLDAAIECRDIALADVARLRVRCDALERLSVDSAKLDVRPADANGADVKPSIILPVSATSARR